ncbi:MAG: carboxypeptidase-like regulatory domain-containing protein [Acidobacteriota bacterium]|nr:carboxypeptidase-like regulatory domain-containing protein [Acidobacteriota bacterium]
MSKRNQRIAWPIVAVLSVMLSVSSTMGMQQPKGRISGTVVSDRGRPVKFATVQLYLESPSTHGEATPSTVTDRKGKFVLDNLRPGVYRLQVYQVGYLGTQSGGDSSMQLTLEEGQEITDLHIELTSGGAITGKVTDEDGDPLVNVSVTAWQKDQQGYLRQVNQAQTDDRGVYRIFGLPAGEYVMSCHVPQNMSRQASYGVLYYPDAILQKEATVLSLSSGSELTGIDFQLQSNRGVTLTGKVTIGSSGQPVAGLHLTLYGEQLSLSTLTGPDGQYEFTDLPPGRFYLQSFPTTQNVTPIQQQINVASKGTVQHDIQLPEGGQIVGRIELIGGRPISHPDQIYATIELTPTNPQVPSGIGSLRIKIEPDGTFILGGLPSARVRFTAQAINHRYFLQGVYRGDVELPRNEVLVEAGKKLSNIRLVFSDQVGTVRGHVRQSDGQSTSYQVILVPADPALWADQRNYRFGWSDGQQPFHIEGVPAGRYLVFTIDGTVGFGGESWVRKYRSRAGDLSVRAGEIEDIEVTPLEIHKR